jgi:hypothetical protein
MVMADQGKNQAALTAEPDCFWRVKWTPKRGDAIALELIRFSKNVGLPEAEIPEKAMPAHQCHPGIRERTL